MHEGAHKRLWDAGQDGSGWQDYQTHEMVSWYVEFPFYTNLALAARRDPDIGKDYQWYRRNPEEVLTHACVTYAFTKCQP